MHIRPIDVQTIPGGSIQTQRASAEDFGGGIANAEQNLAEGFSQAGAVFDRIQNEKDQMWAANTASAKQLGWLQDLNNRKTDPDFTNQYGADGGLFAEKYDEALQKDIEDTVGNAPTGRAQRYLAAHLTEIKNGLMQHAIAFQAQTGGAYVRDQLEQSMQADAKVASMSPEDAGQVMARGKANIANLPYLTPEQKMELSKQYEQNIALAAGKGLVLRSPEAVLNTLAPDQLAMFKPTERVLKNMGTPVTAFTPARNTQPVAKYAGATQQYAAQYGVDANFMQAQQMAESGGNPAAINTKTSTGEASVGLTQFQPATAAQYGIDPKDPVQAIKGQAAYMSDLLRMFGGDYRKAAAAYNWGQGNVQNAIAKYGDKWLDHAPQETQTYLKNIFDNAQPAAPANAVVSEMQNTQNTSEPLRAANAPDWFNKLNWQQQFEIIHDAEQGVRANQVRDSQRLALQKQQQEIEQKQTMNVMFDKLMDGKLSVDDVRQSNLDYQGKEHMIEAINKGIRQEAKTDPQVFQELFNRIHAPESDPNRISDDNALLPYMGKGLSFEDLNKLRNELHGKNTADGATVSDLKKNFFSMAKGQIDNSTFLSSDPIGKQKFYEFQQAALAYIDKKTRGGADTLDLFNPQSKDYVGKLIGQFTRSPQQQMQDYSNFMMQTGANGKQAVEPRKPGESPADYLARTGKAQ